MPGSGDVYVRMLSIPCGQRIDWAAAQAELDELLAEDEDDDGMAAPTRTRSHRTQ